MQTFAYCCAAFKASVRLAAGVEPATCPPIFLESFDPRWLEVDFVYLKLHGLPDQPYWYGDDWITAINADQLASADLSRTTVFVANCYLPESPMLAALRAARARYILGGEGPNYASPNSLTGADLLGCYFHRNVQRRLPPALALFLARRLLRRRANLRDYTVLDALQFRNYT